MNTRFPFCYSYKILKNIFLLLLMTLIKMLATVSIPFLQSVTISNILAAFGVLILALCSAFCWHQWKLFKKYKGFASQRFEAKILLLSTMKKYSKDSPITKSVFQMLLNAVKAFQEKGVCVVWFLKPYVLVYSADHMKDLVNAVDLADKSAVYDITKQLFGNGILGSKHEEWKIQRKLLNSAFKLDVLKSRMPILNKNALQLVQKLEKVVDKQVIDVLEYLKQCAFYNMADFVLGLNLDDKRHMASVENFMKIVDTLSEHFIRRIFHPWLHFNCLLPLFPVGRNYLNAMNEIENLVREVLNELIADREKEDLQVMKTCGSIILKLHLQDHIFTERDVRDQLVNFTAAGYDTVVNTMLWCLYTLARHPQVQQKAYTEIESLVPDGDITYDDLAKMKYLDCVIKEILRLYPTIPITARKARNDIQCGQYIIPKGSDVCFFIFMLHRDPNVFQEPEKFDPERFMDTSAIRSWMYIPFSEGYRNCIGKKFALMEVKVQLVHILRRFRITSQDKIDESDLDWTVVLQPGKNIQFLFEKRQSKDFS